MKTLRTLLQEGDTLYGVLVTINDSCVSETLSVCFDWLWIDMEHAPLSLNDVRSLAQAADKGCNVLVRIPVNSEEWIKRVLDLGVAGIIVPHVNTYEEAKRIAEVSYYPPQGQRSIGCCRVSQYGMNGIYKQQANANRIVCVQIEDARGVGNINEIATVPGIDGIIIGPYDLSGSYNKLGQLDDSEVVEAIEKVRSVCKKNNKPIGIFAKDALAAKQYIAKGFQLIAIGIDIHYLWTAAKASLDSLNDESAALIAAETL
jgi:2-keto-3-deoxy-L-rhamnonate aldolase RhmA